MPAARQKIHFFTFLTKNDPVSTQNDKKCQNDQKCHGSALCKCANGDLAQGAQRFGSQFLFGVVFPNVRVRGAVLGVQKWGGALTIEKTNKKKKHTFLTSQVRCADMPAARQKIHFFMFFYKKRTNIDPK